MPGRGARERGGARDGMTDEKAGPEVGVVAIGRNEGERLRRCLESARRVARTVVYVDSGSRDGSVATARALGAEVVELDLSRPFTAARARNEGLKRLRELRPGIPFVQFVDGDCEIVEGWISRAVAALDGRAELAVVCGRRRERRPDATIYNRLCDLEWDTPVGEAEACGGDALMRVAALAEAGGYDARLIAGEEPDLCLRLRRAGHAVARIDAEMTLHDAAMTRFGQWWRRMMRSGYASAESLARNGASTPGTDRRCVRGAVVWGIAFPGAVAIADLAALLVGRADLALLALAAAIVAAAAQTLRIAVRDSARGHGPGDRLLYAAACMVGKVPQLAGMLRYARVRRRSLEPTLLEYK